MSGEPAPTPGVPGGPVPASRRARWEVAAVIATGLTHLFFEEVLHEKAAFIALAAAGWLAYFVLRVRREPRSLREWGFRLEGLGEAFVAPTVFFLVAAASIAGLAAARGTLEANPHLIPILLLYPLWGITQQFLVQALVARNLERRMPRPWLVLLVASLFAVVHAPDPVLMGATFLLGIAFTPMYLRSRNLIPLGLYHGVLGALVYFWVLGRDPWREVFG
jgi:membrane protease YdiL (CAAX protease family)